MGKRLRRIDIFLLILLAWVLVCFFFFSRGTFLLFFWLWVISAGLRLLFIVKRKLLWKIRNRLIVSGIFFTITPIIVLSAFFLLIINILISQYNTVILQNILNAQLKDIDQSLDYYFQYTDPQRIVQELRVQKTQPPFLHVVFCRLAKESFVPFFVYPADFPVREMDLQQVAEHFGGGFFKWNDRLYHGRFRRQGALAAFIFDTIDQTYLNNLPPIGDFRVVYSDPESTQINRRSLSVHLPDKSMQEIENSSFAWIFTFKYMDFDHMDKNGPGMKFHFFLLLNDYSKIFQKLKSSDKSRLIKQEIENLQKSLAQATDTQTTERDQVRLEELQNELKAINRSDSQQSLIPISAIMKFIIGLFGFFIVVSLLIGFLMVRLVTKSVNQLTSGIERIRKGDFSFRIKLKSHDQMQYLAESFNEMASGIDRLLIEEKEKERLEEELRIARSIQIKLLPGENFTCSGFDIAAVNIPAQEIAGDYFDYFHSEDEFLSVLVADVAGKGASAAFYMAELKGVMNYLQQKGISPADIISECHNSLRASFDKVVFITMNIARFDIPNRLLRIARSGHTPILYYDCQKGECAEYTPRGVAIGLSSFDRGWIEELEIAYQPGDILFFFSDGLSDITNPDGEALGIANLRRLLTENAQRNAFEIRQRILDFGIEFAGSQPNEDDLTFVVVKIK